VSSGATLHAEGLAIARREGTRSAVEPAPSA
jgi:hypothetical protein